MNHSPHSPNRSWGRRAKRALDVAVALTALVLLSPVLVVLSIAVFLTMGRPILFRQQRPGYGERIFTIFKFRTMTAERDDQGNLLPDEVRLTRLGKLMRSLSLDELPQLFNVIKGELSLVGPRPLLVRYLDRYTPEQRRRHLVPPGITGWAQINGRNALTWEDKFKLDVWYVDNWSWWLDMRILFLTALKVVQREGISQEGQATMEEFMGDEGRREQP